MDALCTIVAVLQVIPPRSLFIQYENISLSCVKPGVSSGWRLKRNTTKNKNEECAVNWGIIRGSECLSDLYVSDTGVYWCEFEEGTCSDAVNITVTGEKVILESPVHPVQAGEAVNLRCRTLADDVNIITGFYKDDVLIGTSSTGNITIHSVSKADEGLYKCDIDGVGESKSSWLTVRGHGPGSSPRLRHILLPVFGVCLLLTLVTLLLLYKKHKDKMDTVVAFPQEVQVTRDAEINTDSVLYSVLMPPST